MDRRVPEELASCCGVNLAVAAVGVGFFPQAVKPFANPLRSRSLTLIELVARPATGRGDGLPAQPGKKGFPRLGRHSLRSVDGRNLRNGFATAGDDVAATLADTLEELGEFPIRVGRRDCFFHAWVPKRSDDIRNFTVGVPRREVAAVAFPGSFPRRHPSAPKAGAPGTPKTACGSKEAPSARSFRHE
jgi:hypothetical protein